MEQPHPAQSTLVIFIVVVCLCLFWFFWFSLICGLVLTIFLIPLPECSLDLVEEEGVIQMSLLAISTPRSLVSIQ